MTDTIKRLDRMIDSLMEDSSPARNLARELGLRDVEYDFEDWQSKSAFVEKVRRGALVPDAALMAKTPLAVLWETLYERWSQGPMISSAGKKVTYEEVLRRVDQAMAKDPEVAQTELSPLISGSDGVW